MTTRKTKIICTLGPSTDKDGVLRTIIEEGMDIARFNFSHGTHEEQLVRLEKLRKLREELHRPVAALLDTIKGICKWKSRASERPDLYFDNGRYQG